MNICIGACFLVKFPVETSGIVRCMKIAAHSSTDIFPTDLQIKSSSSISLTTWSQLLYSLGSSKLSFSICHQYSILHAPKSAWRSLLAYPFLFLEMPKQLCILRPIQCSRNTYRSEVDSGEEIHIKGQETHAGFLPAVAFPPLYFSSHTFANTSKKFTPNAATCHQSNYLCSFNN